MIVIRIVALVVLAATAAFAAAGPLTPSADWLVEQVRILSAPDMEGRASGTPGAERGALHIAAVFRAAGLRPGGDAAGYFQSFPVTTGIRLGPANALTIVAPVTRAFALGGDFVPLAVSGDGTEETGVVFAGYGITAPDLRYDDYAAVDVRGKTVLALAGDPGISDPASPFRRPDVYHYSERSHKVINAREHGARAVLLVARPGVAESLPPLAGISQSWSILAAFVTRSTADALLGPSGARLADLADGIDRTLVPRSFALGVRVRLEVSLLRDRGSAVNVLGVLPGTDPRLREEAIVVGAHYDHLGRGGEGSLAPDRIGTVHPGADDNASGTAAVMALARAFAAAGGVPRTLVFAAFAGEEMGLLGSAQYVRRPTRPLARTVLMLNLDMVGRLREGRLYVIGVESGTGLRDIVTAAGSGVDLQLRGDPFAPSDHTTFYGAGRPVLFFFTGAHGDYHRPTDTWEKIDGQGLAAVTAFAARVIAAVAATPTAPAYVRLEAPASAGGRGYGPFFGVVPEFGETERGGVRVSSVRAGSPAERAGVRAGDVIVGFAGLGVKTLEDFTFALRGRRPGDRVDVIVVRDGSEHRVQAVLEERR